MTERNSCLGYFKKTQQTKEKPMFRYKPDCCHAWFVAQRCVFVNSVLDEAFKMD